MFERYTEKARRVIFFARYEASESGSPYIETEHLLLAILREDTYLSRQLLAETPAERWRKEIEARTVKGQKISTSVDIPLSGQCQRALTYAREEAERYHDKYIGPEHLLLGLLREPSSLAADLLNSHGISFETGSEYIAALRDKARDEVADLVQIHGRLLRRSSLQPKLRASSRFVWRKQQWEPLDILVEKGTSRIFFGLALKEDPQFELVCGGWTQAQCEICGWELKAASQSMGYTNGRDWVCIECYTNFLYAGPPPIQPSSS